MSSGKPRRVNVKISLQSLLLSSFLILSVGSVFLVGYISFYNSQNAVNDVASLFRREINNRIEDHLDAFLGIPERINRINAYTVGKGLIDVEDQKALESHFWEQIRIFDSVSSIYFGNTAGGLVNAGREGKGGAFYTISTDDFKAGTFRKFALDESGNPVKQTASIDDFDARNRSWYIEAEKKGGSVWSDPYILFTGQDMAISVSRPVFGSRGNFIGTAAVDIFLSHLGDFLAELEIGKTGQSFIMERSGLLIASSRREKPFSAPGSSTGQYRVSAVESSDFVIRGAVGSLFEHFDKCRSISEPVQFEFLLEKHRHFGQASPIRNEYGLDWLIVTAIPENEFMEQINDSKKQTAYMMLLVMASVSFMGILITFKIVNPIRNLNVFAHSLARGEWGNPISHDSRIREISVLTETYNHMAGRLEALFKELSLEIDERKQAEAALEQAQEKLIKQERLAAVGQLSAGIAHEFNNILTGILGYTELLQMSKTGSENDQKILEIISGQGHRAADLVRQLLDFSQKSIRRPLSLDLIPVVKDVFARLKTTVPESVLFELDGEPGEFFTKADPDHIRTIITNLVSNACDAMPDGGSLIIGVSRLTTEEEITCTACGHAIRGEWIQLSVSDTGKGIPGEAMPHIFEPFFTTKRVGMGSGLGLAQVYGIVVQHYGHISVKSRMGEGTVVSVFLLPSVI